MRWASRPDAAIGCRDFKIGCIGAGFIMADVHLAAYVEAGFPVVAIASRNAAKAAEVARRWGIGRVHETPEQLIEDREVEIVDIAFPPDQQPDLIRHALKQPHVKAILAQKPLALGPGRGQGRSRRSAGTPARCCRSTRTCASTSRCACSSSCSTAATWASR